MLLHPFLPPPRGLILAPLFALYYIFGMVSSCFHYLLLINEKYGMINAALYISLDLAVDFFRLVGCRSCRYCFFGCRQTLAGYTQCLRRRGKNERGACISRWQKAASADAQL